MIHDAIHTSRARLVKQLKPHRYSAPSAYAVIKGLKIREGYLYLTFRERRNPRGEPRRWCIMECREAFYFRGFNGAIKEEIIKHGFEGPIEPFIHQGEEIRLYFPSELKIEPTDGVPSTPGAYLIQADGGAFSLATSGITEMAIIRGN